MTTPKFICFGQPEVAPVDKVIDPLRAVSGNPAQKSWLYADEVSAKTKAGMWDCQAGVFHATMDGIIEFCHILEGSAEITNLDTGDVHTIKVGDAFVMQDGFRGEWHVSNYVRKYFVITQTN